MSPVKARASFTYFITPSPPSQEHAKQVKKKKVTNKMQNMANICLTLDQGLDKHECSKRTHREKVNLITKSFKQCIPKEKQTNKK